MAGTYFKLDTQTLANAINKGIQQIGNTKGLMEAVGETLTSGAKSRFTDETAPDGTKWVKGKKSRGKTLSGSTGNLKKMITHNAGITEVEYGSKLEYAAIHQFGGEIKAKKGKSLKFTGADGKPVFVKKVTIPARPFIGISKEDEAEIKEMVAQHMQESFLGGAT